MRADPTDDRLEIASVQVIYDMRLCRALLADMQQLGYDMCDMFHDVDSALPRVRQSSADDYGQAKYKLS
jgi:hypothetical protein